MVRKQVTIETTVCDICGGHEWVDGKCIVCGKDLCSDCNATVSLTYKAKRIYLCPEHAKQINLADLIERLNRLD